MKNRFSARKISTSLTVFALLFVSAFSVIIFAQGAAVPDAPYTAVQNFDAMTATADVAAYYNQFGFETGCSATLSLSAGGGYNSSQAAMAAFELNYQSSWLRFGTDQSNLTSSGEGLSFWVNVDCPMRIQATAWCSSVEYKSNMVTLAAGDSFVQIPWGDFKGKEEWTPYNDVVLEPNRPDRNVRIGFMVFPVADELTTGTVCIDEVGYLNTAPTTTIPATADNDYELFQDFEAMTSLTDLQGFFPCVVADEDSSMTMSFSNELGYLGSQCAKFDYTPIVSWSNIGDQALETNRYHAKGDGFSFWINTSRGIRIRLDVYDGWEGYQGEMITLTAGQQFVQIPWTTVKTTGGVNIVPNNPTNTLMRVRIAVFNEGAYAPGTFYIDEIGYYTQATSPTTGPENPVIDLISNIGTVTPGSESDIAAAKAAYDALSESDKLLVTNYNVLTDAIAAFDAFRPTFRGVTIRTSTPWGLRFGTDFDTNAAVGTGYSISKYGTVLLSETKYVSGELVVDTLNSRNSEGTVLSTTDNTTFGVTVINIPEANFNIDLMARTYIVYEDDITGDLFTVYNAAGTETPDASKAFVVSTKEVADHFRIDLGQLP
ncbi:MAG: hypothetical protein PHR14_09520 [Oscillospiraceae bacterium]|nr:hypothetical protein [Oscillospiraceae bacterium]